MKVILFILVSASLCFSSDVLTDSKTGFIWQDDSATKYTQKNWQEALSLCEGLRLDGHDDWRLPSIKELESIIKLSQERQEIGKRFKNIGGSGYYWSSSAHESSKEFAWMMNFKRGFDYSNYKMYERHVRCVRGGSR